MAYLARNYHNGPVPMATICREQDLPRQYMLKIFAALARAGYVRTTRGKGGGFVLAHPPADISILNIIEAIEGPLALNLCQNEPSRCRWDQHNCTVKPLWDDLQQTAIHKLGGFRLDRTIPPSA